MRNTGASSNPAFSEYIFGVVLGGQSLVESGFLRPRAIISTAAPRPAKASVDGSGMNHRLKLVRLPELSRFGGPLNVPPMALTVNSAE